MTRAERLIIDYKIACEALLEEFCDKHGYQMGEAKGDICFINEGELVVSIQTIITDLEENAPEEEFIKWYDYDYACLCLGVSSVNFRSWLHKAPIRTKEQLDELERLKKVKEEAEQKLYDAIKEANINPY